MTGEEEVGVTMEDPTDDFAVAYHDLVRENLALRERVAELSSQFDTGTESRWGKIHVKLNSTMTVAAKLLPRRETPEK